jgi:hypothetical protein
LQSAGASFDEAALRAVTSWHFRPASRSGKPVRSRIRVSFGFFPPPAPEPIATTAAPLGFAALPAATADRKVPPSPVPNGSPNAVPVPVPVPVPTEITVQGAAAQRPHGASDFQITVGTLRLVPRQNAADYLKLAPRDLAHERGSWRSRPSPAARRMRTDRSTSTQAPAFTFT